MLAIGFIFVFALIWGGSALSLMAFINMAHTHWWDFVPLIDFTASAKIVFFPLVITFALSFLTSLLKEVSK